MEVVEKLGTVPIAKRAMHTGQKVVSGPALASSMVWRATVAIGSGSVTFRSAACTR